MTFPRGASVICHRTVQILAISLRAIVVVAFRHLPMSRSFDSPLEPRARCRRDIGPPPPRLRFAKKIAVGAIRAARHYLSCIILIVIDARLFCLSRLSHILLLFVVIFTPTTAAHPPLPPEVRVCEGIVRTPIRPGHRILLSQELHPRGGGDDAIVLLVQSMSESNSEARREGGRGECRAATNIGY